jgi:alkaline phosphatase D
VALTRREFLLLAGAGVGAGVAACSSSGDSSATTSVAADTSTTVAAVTTPTLPAGVVGDVFTLGVAAGDPDDGSVILWTRLAPSPLQTGGGMPATPVDVEWQVATDDAFADVVRAGIATALPEYAHSLHVPVELSYGTVFRYRFRIGDQISAVGRASVLPPATAAVDRVRLAMATCQDYTSGYYAAHRAIAAEPDLDLVLFLGDYIYEFAQPDGTTEADRVNLGPVPVTLDDYRARYARYKTDPDLQAAHAAAPWLMIWDDHEVENDYEDDQAGPGYPDDVATRRIGAYQAWWEHLPVRIDPPTDGRARIYRDAAYGDLLRLYLLDVRQNGDPIPCRDTSTLDVGPTCAEREDPSRYLLDPDQEAWAIDALGASTARWNAVAQGVMIAGLDTRSPDTPATYYLESWDGWPAARTRFVNQIAASGARNPVVLTGDYHASFVNDVRADPADLTLPVVATEFLVTAISTFTFPEDFTAQNPQVRYFEPTNGYALCTVTPQMWRTEFKYVSDVKDPSATVSTGATFVVDDGGVTANRV